MQNAYITYLLKNGWKQINPMSFQNIKKPQYGIFFDTSNQIELYVDNNRKSEKYLLNEQDLLTFLELHDLLN
ncbi:MAG: hypothetical protein JWO44_186 [Bacteroidetes bacterium]|nr:hypothetical protein [Bacteroidota bacterium]